MSFKAGNVWVIKAGSSLLTNHGAGINRNLVERWVDEIVTLRRQGIRVVLVSSGAVAEGMQRLGIHERPRSIHILQAVAATGQMGLIELYESAFQRHGVHTAQVLLTHDDLRSRQRYLNARNTLKQLLDFEFR
jgi:glutamate 5-kinase